MRELSLFHDAALSLAHYGAIPNAEADAFLVAWGHWLGGCNRPFGRQSFGLTLVGVGVISVAVSASTVQATCAGRSRLECVELARLASHPDHRWATRVCLRLWRETAAKCWAHDYWPVKALVSYQNAIRHTGNLYRFDGWTAAAKVKGGKGGGSWQNYKPYDPKTIWVYEVGVGAGKSA